MPDADVVRCVGGVGGGGGGGDGEESGGDALAKATAASNKAKRNSARSNRMSTWVHSPIRARENVSHYDPMYDYSAQFDSD